MPQITANGISIEYETHGNPSDPPLLLVSIAKSSQNYATFAAGKGFAINILSEGQKDVSNTFARPVEDRFSTGVAGVG